MIASQYLYSYQTVQILMSQTPIDAVQQIPLETKPISYLFTLKQSWLTLISIITLINLFFFSILQEQNVTGVVGYASEFALPQIVVITVGFIGVFKQTKSQVANSKCSKLSSCQRFFWSFRFSPKTKTKSFFMIFSQG